MKVWMATHSSGARKAAGSDTELRNQIGEVAQKDGLTGNWSFGRAEIGDVNKDKILTIIAGGTFIQEYEDHGILVAHPDGTVKKSRSK